MTFIKKNWLGTLLCLAIAVICWFLAQITIGSFSFEIIGAPVFAILIGMALSAVFPKLAGHDSLKGGIQFTSKKILQYAVILLGFGLNLGQIAQVGAQSLPVILSTVSISLLTAFVLYKLMKMDKKVSCLIGVGSSICGGSAIAATAPVIDADEENLPIGQRYICFCSYAVYLIDYNVANSNRRTLKMLVKDYISTISKTDSHF